MKKISKILALPLMGLTLMTCNPKYDHIAETGEYNGYDVFAWTTAGRPNITIGEESYGSPRITAKSTDNSKRFDEIYLWEVPEGHELEKYANLDSLQKIYDYIVEYGKNELEDKK